VPLYEDGLLEKDGLLAKNGFHGFLARKRFSPHTIFRYGTLPVGVGLRDVGFELGVCYMAVERRDIMAGWFVVVTQ
jgi:hypothetical protein